MCHHHHHQDGETFKGPGNIFLLGGDGNPLLASLYATLHCTVFHSSTILHSPALFCTLLYNCTIYVTLHRLSLYYCTLPQCCTLALLHICATRLQSYGPNSKTCVLVFFFKTRFEELWPSTPIPLPTLCYVMKRTVGPLP